MARVDEAHDLAMCVLVGSDASSSFGISNPRRLVAHYASLRSPELKHKNLNPKTLNPKP